jgi:tetratricopeptide (TPR) repeat protein
MPGIPGGQGEVLAEGIRPRDNSFTRAAADLLDQAMNATDDAEKASFGQQALDQALAGITEDPENPKSYFQAAVASIQIKDYVAADSMFTRAETLHPRYVLETEPWRERGWVDAYNEAIIPLNAGDLETAAALFEGANTLYDQRHEGLLQLGSVYSRLGRYEESADAFRTARGLLEESREVAMADTAQVATWEEHWSIAQEGFAQSLQLSGQLQEAADLYGSLLAENPDDAGLIGSLASILSEMEMPDSVDALYNNLLNRPGLTEYDLSNAGVGLYRIEQYERAAR